METGDEIVRAPDDFKLVSKLGTGSYGTVYKVSLPVGDDIAVKVVEDSIKYGIRSISEVDIMSRFIHPNLMPSLGVKGIRLQHRDQTVPHDVSLWIFMPLAINELMGYIESANPTYETRTRLIHDICCGVKVLHDNNILHLDIKPENILIVRSNTEHGPVDRAVVSDFGLSIYTDDSGIRSYNKELVTVTYRAPEAFKEPHVYSRKVDIWSLGIVILYTMVGAKTLFRNWHRDWFRDWRRPYQEIISKFSPLARMKNLDDMMSKVPHPYRHIYLDLLDHMLQVDHTNRYNIDQVLSHQVFEIVQDRTLKVCERGSKRQPYVKAVKECKLLHYRGFDFLVRTCDSMRTKTETMFLAADLYQRILHYFPIETDDMTKEWPLLSLITLTCFWISYKAIEYHDITAATVISLGGSRFKVDNLLTTERTIIESLGGVIYRSNLYTTSKCIHKLLIAFESLRNCLTYPTLDLQAWEDMIIPGCGRNYCNGCDSFSLFYRQTEYHEWVDGKRSVGPTDYVKCLYDIDMKDISEETSRCELQNSPELQIDQPEYIPNDRIIDDRVEDVVDNRVEEIVDDRVEDILENRVDDILENRVEDIVDNRAEDIVDNRVDDVVYNRIENIGVRKNDHPIGNNPLLSILMSAQSVLPPERVRRF